MKVVNAGDGPGPSTAATAATVRARGSTTTAERTYASSTTEPQSSVYTIPLELLQTAEEVEDRLVLEKPLSLNMLLSNVLEGTKESSILHQSKHSATKNIGILSTCTGIKLVLLLVMW